MGDGMTTGLGAGAAPLAHERADDEKTNLHQAERWATLLGAQLSAVRVLPPPSEPTKAWHPGAGDLTPGSNKGLTGSNATASQAVGNSESADAAENRMIVRVDGGDLGEVALLVDRRAGVLRVTISAADAGAEAALGLERAGLMQALQNHGISVESVTVVRANNFGTVLAPPRLNATQRTREAKEAESTDDEHARRRLARKLNLIG
jgi:hypothetical protein